MFSAVSNDYIGRYLVPGTWYVAGMICAYEYTWYEQSISESIPGISAETLKREQSITAAGAAARYGSSRQS